MKIFTALKNFVRKPKRSVFSIEEYKQQAAIKLGRAQFEKLMQKGLSVPIVLL